MRRLASRKGRIAGSAAGIVTLVAVFFLPFASVPGYIQQGSTLYSAFSGATTSLPLIEKGVFSQSVAITLILIVTGLLVIISGLAGFFPLGSAVIGISGMLLVTFAPFLTVSASSAMTLDPGTGYYTVWAMCIASVGAALTGRGKREDLPAD